MKKIFLSILFFLPVFLQAQDNPIGPFSGLNNQDNPAAIPAVNAQDLLNVDLSLGGRSVLKRDGYGLSYALSITTSPVHGTYSFYDASGNDIALAFNDTRMTSSINGGSIIVLFSTGPNGATYQCIDSQGFGYCVNTSRTNLIKTNGATYSFIAPLSTGTMVTVTPDRLVLSGFGEAPNRIDFSASADFTSWTTGISPLSAFSFTVTAPGSHITHICYAFNRLIWFKDASFGFILQGQTAADWQVQTISPNIGTLDNSSVYYQGILYFRGNDSHIWSYDGSNLVKLTRDIGGTINLSQSRAQNQWIQTSEADFESGISTPTAYLDTVSSPGNVILTTAAAITPFSDTDAVDFGAAFSVTQVDTTTVPGSVILSKGAQTLGPTQGFTNTGLCSNRCSAPYYQTAQVLMTSNALLSSIIVNLKKNNGPGDYALDVRNDSVGTPGALLESVAIPASSVSTSTGNIVVNFSTSTSLISGATYWLTLRPTGTCESVDYIEWTGNSGVGSGLFTFGCGANLTSSTNFIRYNNKVYTSSYVNTGNFVSRTFDVGFTTNTWLWNWATFNPGETLPTGTTMTYQTQTSSSSSGIFESLSPVLAVSTITSSVQEFIRYKTTLNTTIGYLSPILDRDFINMSMRTRPAASYYSAVKNAANLSSWNSFQVDKQDNGGTQTFYIRASTNSIAVTSSTPTWTAISNGATPAISTGTFFQIRDDFLITNATQSPTLQDFTQNWFEGQASDKAYAAYFKDSIWWSVASGAGATTNNKILKFDLLNKAWLLYDIPINGFYIRQNALYFGSSLGGNVFKYGSTSSDNGAAINSYWKSKDFFGDNPFINEDITTLSNFFSAINSSSMTITYTVAGSSATSYVIPLQRLSSSFGVDNKNLPQGTSGNTFSVKFGNNAADQNFEMFGINYTTTSKSWKPGSQ